jgi:hypothetical protein
MPRATASRTSRRRRSARAAVRMVEPHQETHSGPRRAPERVEGDAGGGSATGSALERGCTTDVKHAYSFSITALSLAALDLLEFKQVSARQPRQEVPAVGARQALFASASGRSLY